MSILFLPDALQAVFLAAEDPITLCLSDGRVVGYFTPTKARMLKLDPPELPPGELDRREASGSGRPLKDILRDLEARGEGESGVTVPAN